MGDSMENSGNNLQLLIAGYPAPGPRGVWVVLEVLKDGGCYAFAQGTDTLNPSVIHFLKPQPRFCTDSTLAPTRFGSGGYGASLSVIAKASAFSRCRRSM